MPNRGTKANLQQHRRRIHRRGRGLEAVELFNVLTGPELLEHTDACLPVHRERLYPPTVTLSMFMKQTLAEDGSCQNAVNAWAIQRITEGLQVSNTDTGAYCKARARLPVAMVQALTREPGRRLAEIGRSSAAAPGRRSAA